MSYFRWFVIVSLFFILGAGCAPSSDDDASGENVDGNGDTDSSSYGDTVAGTYPNEDEPPYDICGDGVSVSEMYQFIQGNCVIVASFREQGFSSGRLIAEMLLSIVLNGIDFSNLSAYTVSFDSSTGHYVLGDGGTHVGFTLYFDEDFGAFSKGDAIPYNIFNMNSFVTDVAVTITPTLELDYSYKKGPLYALVAGEAEVDVTSVSDFSVKVMIDPTAVAVAIDSQQTYPGRYPWNRDDRLTLKMTSAKMSLFDFTHQLRSGGVGFGYTGTVYKSVYFGVSQVFEDAEFFIRHEGGKWYWEGDYFSAVSKFGKSLYQSGFVSNVEQNYTEYYCESELKTRIGTARHNLELTGGHFDFEDGRFFVYSLIPY